MFTPKLHLKYAYPLDSNRRQLYSVKNFGYYPSIQEVKNTTNKWQGVWDEINSRVFELLAETTGISLSTNLEMYIFGTGINAMSAPLMTPIMSEGRIFTDDEFIETTIHEISHIFIGNHENNPGIKDYWETIRKDYSNDSISTQNHILIYAILEVILLELFGKDRLADFMNISDKFPDYQKAAEIAKEIGADVLIKQFKDHLK